MATEKRDRQRANRELKRAEEDKVNLRKKRIGIVKRYAIYAIIFGAAIIALQLLTS
ncbi:MAG: hypothetical protein QGM46_04785 [Actinomycetota bacterium]|nr:hypothetical protein [candidate division KSB1 bacterium]MDK1009517.1 hypothetical protein [Actinomycetota bacterium]MDK1016312.1 hypothetical protein [Actinomycetota bacterium]MDK1026851.1 hypothetical protein [Actinomycetota bacterium]MDK1037475.1 hypothetical protein [Actinomycetota bacterium]